MIRRELSLPGRAREWALISQVEHAHLAADLARSWREPLVPLAGGEKPASGLQSELLAAIEHHDDGWAEWEEAPDIDPEHGRPRSFLEMPQVDSLAIWSKSIAVAEQIGPLSAWVVAGHFAALLKLGGDSQPEEAQLAAEWNDLMRVRRSDWLQEWKHTAPGRTQEMAEYALRALQFFDAASLWICCTCAPEGQPSTGTDEDSALTFPGGRQFRFMSRAGEAARRPESAASIQPWPLIAGELDLTVDCHTAPIDRYVAADDLLKRCRRRSLRWRLREIAAGRD